MFLEEGVLRALVHQVKVNILKPPAINERDYNL